MSVPAVRPLRIFVVAGEPSGDLLGERLIRAMTAVGEGAEFAGIGGPLMEAAGLRLIFPYDDLAVMGLVEVLPRIPRVMARWREAIAAIGAFDPDVIVTIDSSGFNKGLAKRLITAGNRAARIHYVAPMVWAWRPGRTREMAKLFHHLMTLFPFEVAPFAQAGLPTTFVGHPAVEGGAGDGPGFRRRHGITPEARLLLVLPGSRRTEVERLLPTFCAAVGRLSAGTTPAVVVPTVPLVAARVRALLAAHGVAGIVVTDPAEKRDAFAAANAALAASGTVTLELALARVPMVVAYRVSALTAWIGRRLISVRHASLPNLLLDEALVPELLQEDCHPERIAEVLGPLLDGSGAAWQREGFVRLADRLTAEGEAPSRQAAAVVLRLARAAARGEYPLPGSTNAKETPT